MKPEELTEEHIRTLRQDRLGWSLAEMAQYIGVSKPTVWRWEQGTSPDPHSRAILAQMWNRLDEIEQEKQRENFIEALKKAALAGGVIALLSILFGNET